ncbi:serine hydrolase [Robiginitalea aurantiaca]|uniref:beta-lactamase n=1 Tax=Robiginitalea aurantiaca TaxID=3056915 RepID=A0ABT7WCL6_9FLAO|nr:serine hydrolase [Robiginitalea aurantiaca]MDM9630643.1 serine hydrolase [Robiginitalea aurantiaca]
MRVSILLIVYLLFSNPVETLPNEEYSGVAMDVEAGVGENPQVAFGVEALQMPELPIKIADSAFKPLESCRNRDLQTRLNKQLLGNPVFARLISSRKLCLGLVDLTDWKNPRYASINGKEMMYAASLPKIAVLLAVEDAIYKGEVEETNALREDMNQMIRYSNNSATSRIIDLLGYEKIESVLRDPENQFYEESEGGGLWVGKMYSRSGKTNREPMKNLSHAANVFQASRFYYRLAYGKLVSYDRSADMLEVMKDPALKHKFVHILGQIAPEAELYRKSGSWKSWHSDSILVWDTDRKYILVALTEDPGGEQIVRSLVRPVEKVLKL